ncbi:hypothetical protein ACFSKM_10875 [Ancylobacter dichloromethanicus]
MRLPLALVVLVSMAVVAVWAWLGQPVPAPVSPLAAGEKLPCVSYAPFRPGQSPFSEDVAFSPAQIDDDLARLSKITRCVRTYSSIQAGLSAVPELARKHGLTVLQGIWIAADPVRNRREIEGGIKAAQENPDVVKAVIVGNEVLLRGEQSANDIAGFLKEVKAKIPAGVDVTYADVWEFWERNRGAGRLGRFRHRAHSPLLGGHAGRRRGFGRSSRRDPRACGRDIPRQGHSHRRDRLAERGAHARGGAALSLQPSERHPGTARPLQGEELPAQRHRGVRPAVEAGAGGHGRRALGLPRRLYTRVQVHLGRAGVGSPVLEAAGADRRHLRRQRVRGGRLFRPARRRAAARHAGMVGGGRHRLLRRADDRPAAGHRAGGEPGRRRVDLAAARWWGWRFWCRFPAPPPSAGAPGWSR